MRGRLAPAAVVALVAAGSATARAEDFVVYLDAGTAFPTAPPEFSDFWKTGITIGGGFGLRLSPFWEVATVAHYQRLPADEEGQIDGLLLSGPGGVLEIAGIDGRDVNAIALVSEIRAHVGRPGSAWDPFLAFGAGFFRVSTTDATVTSTDPRVGAVTVLGDTDSALAATVGGGMQYAVSPGWRIVLDSIYTIGFTDQSSTEFLPLRIGVAIGG
jgi:opacity protein-like surface antigen